jgi:enolase-phosphatase E1
MPTYSDQADVILLDIEGTTTPVNYVFSVLFPFARDHVAEFLATQGQEADVQSDLQELKSEYDADVAHGLLVPKWQGSEVTAAVPYIHYLIEIDRKSTGLKSLEGKIWAQGYLEGKLRSKIFSDVKPAFQRWRMVGKRLFIFSSGSVQAQQLLFRYTEAGDLTGFLNGYFDTRTGPKKEADSYRKIADEIGFSSNQILFISDVTSELRAAQTAGMQTLFSWRPGNHSSEPEEFTMIQNFDNV